MIWRSQNNGPDEEDRAESRDQPSASAPEVASPRSAMGSVGERVETVLEAAERAAADIRKDAEQWAQRHMEETRRRADELAARRVQELSSITDDLLARAQAVARQSDDLISALDSASRRVVKVPMRRQEDADSNSNGTHPEPERKAPEPAQYPESSNSSERRPAGPVSDGARLLATQMAVAGSSRDTIESRLKKEFGIEDPSAILDDAGL